MACSKSKILPSLGIASSIAAAMVVATAASASAAGARHRTSYSRAAFGGGVSYAHAPRGGSQLVSDGPGTGFGFYRLPGPYRFAAAVRRDRVASAVRDTIVNDALTNSGPNAYRFQPDSVYANQPYSSYNVFSGGDGYGTPFFAGWYGEGGGADLGPLGHTYN